MTVQTPLCRLNIEPKPTPRVRFRGFKLPNGRIAGNTYYDKAYQEYVKRLVESLRDLDLTKTGSQPVSVSCKFSIPKPKSTKFASPKGDVDNYVKGLLDALTTVGVWDDDRFVEVLHAEKEYGEPFIEFKIDVK